MEIKNLNEQNVSELEDSLKRIKLSNPDVEWRKRLQENIEHFEKSDIERLEKKIDRLHERLDLIFGGSVLMNGQWFNPNQ